MMILVSVLTILIGFILIEDPIKRDFEKDLRNYQKVMNGKEMLKPNSEDIKDTLKHFFSNVFIILGIIMLIYYMNKANLIGGIW